MIHSLHFSSTVFFCVNIIWAFVIVMAMRKGNTIGWDQVCINCYAKHLHRVAQLHLLLKLVKDTLTGHCLMKL